MKKLFAPMVCLIFISLHCLNAPRNNEFDPDNPEKGMLTGTAYELGIVPLNNAVVRLEQSGETVACDTSNAQGTFELNNISAGIYTIVAEALYYTPVEIYPESIWAGDDIDDYAIAFCTFDFEDDAVGTSAPHRFTPVRGAWGIIEDNLQPEAHSVSHIYRGMDNDSSEFALALCDTQAHEFSFEAKLKISSSEPQWQAGIVFRYQDENNYYCFGVSPESTFCAHIKDGHIDMVLYESVQSLSDTWYTLKVLIPEVPDVFRIYRDGHFMWVLVDTLSVNGKCGLFVDNGSPGATASAYFDDVFIQFR